MPDRPDPVTDRLARFTPSPGGLDRDALLFAAGRRSARGSRLWPLATALLVVSQAATLVALWPHETVNAPVIPASSPAVGPAPWELTLPPVSPDPDVWSAGSRFDVVQGPPPVRAGEFVSGGPPLTAGSGFRFD
jgi:hypothetical protein